MFEPTGKPLKFTVGNDAPMHMMLGCNSVKAHIWFRSLIRSDNF